MFLRTETLPSKTFAGKRLKMSFSNNRTFELWKSFMPARAKIANPAGENLYSIEVYPDGFFEQFNPNAEFEKWAAVEISGYDTLPDGIVLLDSPGGLYAVFLHKGPASAGPRTYNYIFGEWLPESGYSIDNRPHFAVMTEKYKADSPDSEEEIFIPIKIIEKINS